MSDFDDDIFDDILNDDPVIKKRPKKQDTKDTKTSTEKIEERPKGGRQKISDCLVNMSPLSPKL